MHLLTDRISGQVWMERAVAVSATSGSLTALLVGLAGDFLSSEAGHFECPICPEVLDWSLGHFEHLDLPSLCLGLLLGLCLGPILDLIYLARSSWRLWIRSRLAAVHSKSSGELYRIV